MTTRKNLLLTLTACLVASVGLFGCNTFRGAGKDIQEGGKAVENAAADAQTPKTAPAAASHNILAKSDSGGSIKPSGSTDVPYGAHQTYAIRPYYGYRVADVFVDGNSIGAVNTHTFNNVTAPHKISAVFVAESRR